MMQGFGFTVVLEIQCIASYDTISTAQKTDKKNSSTLVFYYLLLLMKRAGPYCLCFKFSFQCKQIIAKAL